jgi:hypothetical protein
MGSEALLMFPSLRDKRVRGVLEDAASRGDPRAQAVLDEAKAKAKRRRERSKPTREARGAERMSARERRRTIREQVFERADGVCESCGERTATEMHHAMQGGPRARRESVSLCAAVCEHCHVWAHRGDLHILRSLLAWAKHYGYGMAAAALEHRIAKVRESRSARDEGER